MIARGVLALFLLSISAQQPDDPYGLPDRANLRSDATSADGVRTITYQDGEYRVTVVIDLAGDTVETRLDPEGGVTTLRYTTLFNGDGTRTEIVDHEMGWIRRDTIDANGVIRVREDIRERPHPRDSGSIERRVDREVRNAQGDPVELHNRRETQVVLSNGQQGVIRYDSRSRYRENGRSAREVVERFQVDSFNDDGSVDITHTRRTATRNADGEIEVLHEERDPQTGDWVEVDPEANENHEDAAPEPQGSARPAQRAFYVALAPGVIHVALPDQAGYQWGARGGLELACSRPAVARCNIAVGLGFQHSVGSAAVHQLRAQAEVMPGVRLVEGRLFVFASVGLGYTADVVSLGESSGVAHGVAFSPGAGASYLVWRELFVGGRFGGDLQWFPSELGTLAAHNLALEAFVGWRFGI